MRTALRSCAPSVRNHKRERTRRRSCGRVRHHSAALLSAASYPYTGDSPTNRAVNPTPEALATALRNAYPGLSGEDGVEALAKAMYP